MQTSVKTQEIAIQCELLKDQSKPTLTSEKRSQSPDFIASSPTPSEKGTQNDMDSSFELSNVEMSDEDEQICNDKDNKRCVIYSTFFTY